jgi:hypothetical protein
VDIASDSGYLYPVPLCLFEVIDGRVSQHWQVRQYEDGDLTLWPPSFYREYYHDDLIEGVPEVVDDFRRVRIQIEDENRSAQPSSDFG